MQMYKPDNHRINRAASIIFLNKTGHIRVVKFSRSGLEDSYQTWICFDSDILGANVIDIPIYCLPFSHSICHYKALQQKPQIICLANNFEI